MTAFQRFVCAALCVVLTVGGALTAQTLEEVEGKTAEQLEAEAQTAIGMAYQYGEGVPRDYAQAMSWFRKAAAQGHAGAMHKIAILYRLGPRVTPGVTPNVPLDYVQAAAWDRKAADQGHAGAQHSLGRSYQYGEGVQQNYAQALFWLRKAAAQGEPASHYMLGGLYEDGTGVPQDFVEAHKWYNLAAARDADGTDNVYLECRDRVAKQMLPAQIAEAQRLARE